MQQIKSYTNYQEFWHFAKPILLQHEAHNNLALGVALRAEHKPEQLKLGLVLFVDGQASKVAIISAFQGGTLILSHTWELADLSVLQAFLISNEVALYGVVAQVKLSEKFAESWCQRGSVSYELLHHTEMLIMEKLQPSAMIQYSLRQARNSDLAVITEPCQQFLLDIYPQVPKDEIIVSADTVAQQFIADGFGFILENNSRNALGIVEIIRQTPKYQAISTVAVLPINRGKGYGRALITMICAQIFKSGKIPLLFVDKNNPLTLHLYYSLGFAAISETKHYIFKFT
ncbi:MAG TPA: GNAT family N-acetyltransferase [Burkholderiales bacterium]|nr:GNAT family N-acetyltransferase [Burkholderiales bacterium]